MNKDNFVKKGLVFGIIILFVGASVVPNLVGNVKADPLSSYIVVHALNPEGIEIGSIEGIRPYNVEIYDGDTWIGYGAHDNASHNMPIAISSGFHTIKVKFNGMTLEKNITVESEEESQTIIFTFSRTTIDIYNLLIGEASLVGETLTSFGGGYSSYSVYKYAYDDYGVCWLGTYEYPQAIVWGSAILTGMLVARMNIGWTIGIPKTGSGSIVINSDATQLQYFAEGTLSPCSDPRIGNYKFYLFLGGGDAFINPNFINWYMQANAYEGETSVVKIRGIYLKQNLPIFYIIPASGSIDEIIISAKTPSYWATPGTSSLDIWNHRQGILCASIPYDITGTGIKCEENQPPVANFTYSPEEPTVNEEITFDASSSYDPDGQIESYEWSFGDGNTANGEIVTHNYSEVGNYTVTLLVMDNDGLIDSLANTINTMSIIEIIAWAEGHFILDTSQDWSQEASSPLHVEVLENNQPVGGATIFWEGISIGQTDSDGKLDIRLPIFLPPVEGLYITTVEAQFRGISVESNQFWLYDCQKLKSETMTLNFWQANIWNLYQYMNLPSVPGESTWVTLLRYYVYSWLDANYIAESGDKVSLKTYRFTSPDGIQAWLIHFTVWRNNQFILELQWWTENEVLYNEAVTFNSGTLMTSFADGIVLASPAVIYVSAPDGSQAGYDPSTGELVYDFPIAISNPGDDPFQLYIPSPEKGKYLLDVVGTGSGDYNLLVQSLDTDLANETEFNFTDQITEYETHNYLITHQEIGEIFVARVWYVDDSNTIGPWKGTSQHPYQKIQDAIDNASDGDMVFVFNGTYYENIFVDKSINLIGEDKDTTIIDGNNNIVIDVTANYVNISGFNLQNGMLASLWLNSNHSIISDNIICSSDISIVLINSSYNIIFENNISSYFIGVALVIESNHNLLYHNNFINNTFKSAIDECNNTWDNGYPSGGNYWDDYTGEDNFSGPNQDIHGGDGIGDIPYYIHGDDSWDWYPLTKPYKPDAIPTVIDINPDTLNLNSSGNWVTCYIELPEGYDVANINISTILLNDVIPSEDHPTNISDYDNDGVPDLMIKFDRHVVQSILELGEDVAIMVTGKLIDGMLFEGIDYIRVI